MAEKLVVVTCPAGINTSTLGVSALEDALLAAGRTDVQVVKVNLSSLDSYTGRAAVIVEMTPTQQKFPCPAVSGIPFIAGTREERRRAVQEVLRLLD